MAHNNERDLPPHKVNLVTATGEILRLVEAADFVARTDNTRQTRPTIIIYMKLKSKNPVISYTLATFFVKVDQKWMILLPDICYKTDLRTIYLGIQSTEFQLIVTSLSQFLGRGLRGAEMVNLPYIGFNIVSRPPVDWNWAPSSIITGKESRDCCWDSIIFERLSSCSITYEKHVQGKL